MTKCETTMGLSFALKDRIRGHKIVEREPLYAVVERALDALEAKAKEE